MRTPPAKTAYGYSVFIIIVLVIFALFMGVTRYLMYSSEEPSDDDNFWVVTLDAKLNISDDSGRLSIEMPWDTRHVKLFGQSVSHLGMRIKRNTGDDAGKRKITLLPTAAGSYSVRVQFSLLQSYIPQPERDRKPLSDTALNKWLVLDQSAQDKMSILEQALKKFAQVQSPEATVSKVFDFVSEQIQGQVSATSDGAVAISQRKGSTQGKVNAMVLLLRTAQIPARVVTGIDLETDREMSPLVQWVEAYYDDRWHPYDLVYNRLDLPESYVPFSRGSDSIITATEGIEVIHSSWVIEIFEEPIGARLVDSPGLLSILDLTHFPRDVQHKLALMLLLPLGLLATEFLRKVFGVRTFGVFTPTLLALAAVFVEWSAAIVMFVIVVIIGVAGRSVIPQHEMGRDARLSMVFVMVTLTIIIAVAALVRFDFAVYDSISILPVVIVASMIDRIYAVIDQNGYPVALYRMMWTVVAAILSLFLLMQHEIGDILLVYPELHALTMALIICLGMMREYCLKNCSWFKRIQLYHEPPVMKPARARKSGAKSSRRKSATAKSSGAKSSGAKSSTDKSTAEQSSGAGTADAYSSDDKAPEDKTSEVKSPEVRS